MKSDGNPLEIADGSDPKLIARPDPSDFQDALAGEDLCGFLGAGNIFVAIRPIPGAEGQFLYAARGIDPLAAKVAEDAASVASLWGRFEAHRHSLELGFATVFVMLALTMLFSAIWLGLTFANRLVGPIRRLIRATDEVASGNLHVQVPTRASDGDLGHLGDTFNKMTVGALAPADRPDRRQRAQRRAARLHRGGAVGRARGRRRRRQGRRHHGLQRRRRAAARRRAGSWSVAARRRPPLASA